VIAGVSIEAVDEGTRVRLWPCYGLTGTIIAREVRVELTPR